MGKNLTIAHPTEQITNTTQTFCQRQNLVSFMLPARVKHKLEDDTSYLSATHNLLLCYSRGSGKLPCTEAKEKQFDC